LPQHFACPWVRPLALELAGRACATPRCATTPTRLRIIRVAADLFHKQGVRATSPDQIIETSGTGKGPFYHYFKNKEGLVHEVLQSHLEAIRNRSAPLNYETDSWQNLEEWFRAQIQLQKSYNMTRGCPFGTIGNEITRSVDSG
jgi:AcrR family transcriptional regulator